MILTCFDYQLRAVDTMFHREEGIRLTLEPNILTYRKAIYEHVDLQYFTLALPFGFGKTFISLEYLRRSIVVRPGTFYLVLVSPLMFTKWVTFARVFYSPEFIETNCVFARHRHDLDIRKIYVPVDPQPEPATVRQRRRYKHVHQLNCKNILIATRDLVNNIECLRAFRDKRFHTIIFDESTSIPGSFWSVFEAKKYWLLSAKFDLYTDVRNKLSTRRSIFLNQLVSKCASALFQFSQITLSDLFAPVVQWYPLFVNPNVRVIEHHVYLNVKTQSLKHMLHTLTDNEMRLISANQACESCLKCTVCKPLTMGSLCASCSNCETCNMCFVCLKPYTYFINVSPHFYRNTFLVQDNLSFVQVESLWRNFRQTTSGKRYTDRLMKTAYNPVRNMTEIHLYAKDMESEELATSSHARVFLDCCNKYICKQCVIDIMKAQAESDIDVSDQPVTREGFRCPFCRDSTGLDELCLFRFFTRLYPYIEQFGPNDKTVIFYSNIHRNIIGYDVLIQCIDHLPGKNFFFINTTHSMDESQRILDSFYRQTNSFLVLDSEILNEGMSFENVHNVICFHSFLNPYLYEHLFGRFMRPERQFNLKVFYFHNK